MDVWLVPAHRHRRKHHLLLRDIFADCLCDEPFSREIAHTFLPQFRLIGRARMKCVDCRGRARWMPEPTKGEHNSPKSAPQPSAIQWEQMAARHNIIVTAACSNWT